MCHNLYTSTYPLNIQSSLEILGFTTSTPASLHELNKRYHMLALKYHPDKFIQSEPEHDHADMFKKINESHKQVKEYFYSEECNHDIGGGGIGTGYNSILNLFMKSLFVKMPSRNHSETISSIIQAILNKGIQSAILLFHNMDKHTCIAIYDILSNNQELFSISREIMDELTQIMESKIQNDTIITLNPTLSDMLLDRVYILRDNGNSYYIPLWHSQLHFKQRYALDCSDNDAELIVVCEPELPSHVTIDEYNNLYIAVDININDLFRNQYIDVTLDDDAEKHGFTYKLCAGDVTFQTETKQRICLQGNRGIACCGRDGDMYNVSKRANVYAVVRLVTTL